MNINRFAGNAVGRNRAVEYAGLVFTVATAPDTTDDVSGQTTQTLVQIDRNLTDAGSDKTKLLSATVYITDISKKAEMDKVWNEWIGPDNWPQRACVQVGLAGSTLVEITVIAAK
ncbi:MAG: RidA family protein [Gammaproteobacteria bacterium]|nr:RidA family protein [Gammaproteobacteria bacterium]